jgi:hypothetical protein
MALVKLRVWYAARLLRVEVDPVRMGERVYGVCDAEVYGCDLPEPRQGCLYLGHCSERFYAAHEIVLAARPCVVTVDAAGLCMSTMHGCGVCMARAAFSESEDRLCRRAVWRLLRLPSTSKTRFLIRDIMRRGLAGTEYEAFLYDVPECEYPLRMRNRSRHVRCR